MGCILLTCNSCYNQAPAVHAFGHRVTPLARRLPKVLSVVCADIPAQTVKCLPFQADVVWVKTVFTQGDIGGAQTMAGPGDRHAGTRVTASWRACEDLVVARSFPRVRPECFCLLSYNI